MPRLAHLALATTAAALRPVTRRNLGPAGLGLATGLAYRQHAAYVYLAELEEKARSEPRALETPHGLAPARRHRAFDAMPPN